MPLFLMLRLNPFSPALPRADVKEPASRCMQRSLPFAALCRRLSAALLLLSRVAQLPLEADAVGRGIDGHVTTHFGICSSAPSTTM